MLGETIGNFRVLRELGRGGMGSVYLAEQTAVQTHVAIKVLHRDISSDREHVQRFFNEARIVGKIKHSAIVKIFDVGLHKEHAYLVMELLDGESLASRIHRMGRLSVAQIVDIGRQTASALAATHDAGIIHRDLKPDNVYIVNDEDLGRRERIKVLDFGIAKLSGTLSAVGPQTAGTMGTPPYMAPEQWGDSGSVDWRADAYSLGCMVFEMACGRPPFIVRTIAEACTQHLTKRPPLASSLVQLPPVLDALIDRLLAKDPSARATSMADLAREFAALGGRESIELDARSSASLQLASSQPRAAGVATTIGASSGAIAGPTEHASRPRRWRWVAIASGVAAASVLALVAWQRTAADPDHVRAADESVTPSETASPRPPATRVPPPPEPAIESKPPPPARPGAASEVPLTESVTEPAKPARSIKRAVSNPRGTVAGSGSANPSPAGSGSASRPGKGSSDPLDGRI